MNFFILTRQTNKSSRQLIRHSNVLIDQKLMVPLHRSTLLSYNVL